MIEGEEIEEEELSSHSDTDSEFYPSKTSAKTQKTTTFRSPEYVTPVNRRKRERKKVLLFPFKGTTWTH